MILEYESLKVVCELIVFFLIDEVSLSWCESYVCVGVEVRGLFG